MFTDRIMLSSLEHMIETVNKELGDQRCPVHGEAPHVTISMTQTGELKINTTSCCQLFDKTTTAPLQRNLNQTAYFSPTLKLILRVQGTKYRYVYDATKINRLELGRADKEAGEQPDVNLQEAGALEKGVSRRHAVILWHRGALHIGDNNSANGTFLNEQRVDFDQPQILHDGDKLRLGQLTLEVMLGSS